MKQYCLIKRFLLLKNAFVLPRLMYSLRSGLCFLQDGILHEFDNVVQMSQQRIADIQRNDTVWVQLTLTTKTDGFGGLSAIDLAPAAFHESCSLIDELVAEIWGQPLENELSQAALTT